MDSIPIARSKSSSLRNQHQRLVMGGLCSFPCPRNALGSDSPALTQTRDFGVIG
jgi:hypothetical protein